MAGLFFARVWTASRPSTLNRLSWSRHGCTVASLPRRSRRTIDDGAVIYLTHTRLMTESERTVRQLAANGDDAPRLVCAQLVAEPARYALWHARHDNGMTAVAARKLRDSQLIELRAICLAQVHQAALVRYLREYGVPGNARDALLREFYGIMDPRRAALAEHRQYLVAASTQLCATELLTLADDHRGVDLVRRYEITYGQFFSMFCDRARARQGRKTYVLGALIPEIKEDADRLRARIVGGDLLPSPRIAVSLAASKRRRSARAP
jgi:hypothetical protein